MKEKRENELIETGFSRREFLIKGGIVFGGTLILLQSGCAPVHRSLSGVSEKLDLPSGVKDFNPHFWFRIKSDNTIEMVMPKAEMGQGIFTGFAMIAAEELEVNYDQISVRPSNTNDPVDIVGTGGSTSTMSLYLPIREVAAQMRLMLIKAAAKKWNVKESDLTTRNGYVQFGDQSLSYFQITESTDKWDGPGKPTLKEHGFKIIGTDVKRTDILAKIKGEPVFGIDHEIEGMVHGVFVKSPFVDATPISVNTEKALALKGVEQVLVEDDLIVVIGTNRYAAEMGGRLVEVEWNIPKKWNQQELDQWVTVGNGERSEIKNEGNPKAKLKNESADIVKIEYRTSAGAHAQLEPNGAIAHFENDKVTIIAGLQVLPSFQKQVAKLLGIKTENVFIQNAFLGGGFGRRSFYQDVAKIALVSKKIGKPVHIFNTRQQEFQNGYLRPSTHHRFEVQLIDGKIEAMDYQLATDNMVLSYYPEIAEFLLGSDPASAHGSRVGYDIPHINISYWKTKLPFNVGSWRGIGMFANTFAIESVMDELSLKAGIDPIDFRLNHLHPKKHQHHHRLESLLKKIQDDGLWARAKQDGIGRGFACAEDRGTLVGTVAEIVIEDSQIKVKKITSVIDAGKIVNPEGVRQQVEGCAIMGIGASLMEKIEVQDGKIINSNFHKYTVPFITDIPNIEVVLISSEEPPLGVGEPPIAPISAAIANAVFDLTKKRLRSLPLNLDEGKSNLLDHAAKN